MVADLVVLAVGLAVLLGGGALLLRGAKNLALSIGMAPVVVGATVVAFGTSAPELVVTVAASLREAGGIAFGNVLGSNTTNVFLILGIAAAFNPIHVRARVVRWEIPALLVATFVILVFSLGGGLNSVEGIVMLVAFAAFLAVPRFVPWITGPPGEAPAEATDRLWVSIVSAVVGLVALALGSELVVRSATSLAMAAGVDEFVVGMVLVALGTSLPELVTVSMAAWRGEHDLAVGNVVGSNVFNLLAVAGAGSLLGGIPVRDSLFAFELPVMAISSVVLMYVAWSGCSVGRREGIAMLAAYAATIAVVALRGG